MPRRNDRRAIEDVQARLQRARWRLRVSSLGGPEWDAATEHLVELEAELDRLRRGLQGSFARSLTLGPCPPRAPQPR